MHWGLERLPTITACVAAPLAAMWTGHSGRQTRHGTTLLPPPWPLPTGGKLKRFPLGPRSPPHACVFRR